MKFAYGNWHLNARIWYFKHWCLALMKLTPELDLLFTEQQLHESESYNQYNEDSQESNESSEKIMNMYSDLIYHGGESAEDGN